MAINHCGGLMPGFIFCQCVRPESKIHLGFFARNFHLSLLKFRNCVVSCLGRRQEDLFFSYGMKAAGESGSWKVGMSRGVT